MIQDYTKMDEPSMQQQNIIISLEQTYQDLKKQQVATHIEFGKQNKV
jgi:hypothetical protein